MADSLVYIPDISGFTDFVKATEINHAQHIISELLEIIIDANHLDLKISEIEGDAVLFYQDEGIPGPEALLRQSEEIFIKFHEHLRRYEVERVCNCGACSTASNLGIKIIAHCGEIGYTQVKDSIKPFGAPLIAAHRLLKNDLELNEYVLLTKPLTDRMGGGYPDNPNWAEPRNAEMTIDGQPIPFSYFPLEGLYERVAEPEKPRVPERIENPLTYEVLIDKPLYFVFEFVSNLDFRLAWNQDIKELVYDQGRLNRMGTKHRCLFNNGFADIETITDDFGDDALVYGERVIGAPAEDLAVFYIMRGEGDKTRLQMEAHYHPKKYWGWIIVPLIRYQMKKAVRKAADTIKEVAEEQGELEYAQATEVVE